MCILGLNDILYLTPEFIPKNYDLTYPDQDTQKFDQFFKRYANYSFFPDDDNIPERLCDQDKHHCTAIEPDPLEPDKRGIAFINVKDKS